MNTYNRGETERTSSDHRYKMQQKTEVTLAILLLALIQGVVAVEVQPSINPAVVGDSVTLSLSPLTNLKSGSWAVGDSLILTWLGDQQAVFPSHSGRVSVNHSTGALTLNSVTVADSGVYVMQSTDPPLKANASITVLEPISNVTLRTNHTDLMEFNSSAVITCSVSSGSSPSFLWINGSSEVTVSDRVHLSDGNSTLTIVNVTRFDQGPFTCHASNPVSNGTSDPVNFTITYGPDNMAITVNGLNTTSFSIGSNLSMLCSAQSSPAAQLQWAFRGELVNTTGPLLELFSVSEDQSGPYSCLAFNNHINMNSNITTILLIGKPSSGSDQQAVNVWLLPLLIMVGFFFSLPAAAGTQKIYASENPIPVGNTVTLFSRDNVSTGAWMFNNDIIVMTFPGSEIITDNWKDRLTLSVQVPISNVTLRANATNLVEFNDTAVLMCSALNGSSLTYAWLKGSTEITAGGGVQLSDGGATLTVRVTRYDEGSYRCNVSNGVSYEVSLPVYLNISYGPSNTTMMITPMKSTYTTGSNITLSCSAESSPPAMIQWMFDGVYLNQFGPQLLLEKVAVSNSGYYRCLFHNAVTSRFSSKSAMIRIEEKIVAVVVDHTGGPAILNESFSMTCEVVGTVGSIQWWRNGQLITADNTTGQHNKTLILFPVQLSDHGDYQCQAFNSVGNMTSSPYTVEVNYGPMKPVIVGSSMALAGTFGSFNCSSASHPPSRISWYFSDSMAATSDLVIGPLTLNMSGVYTCEAYNNITGKTNTASIMLTVLAPVTMASVKIVGAEPIQNHTFSLTCETSGSVESIIWLYNGYQLSAGNTRNFSVDHATLTIDPVMTSDNGNYQCVASNPLSIFTSQVFTLGVFYGPEMPTIIGPNMANVGDNVTFSCSASSNPPSSYEWFFNGSLVANTSEYVTPPLTKAMSGLYTCMAYNNITGKNSTTYTMLTVFAPVTMASIKMVEAEPILNHTFSLTCETSGSVESIIWLYNGYQLSADSTRNFSVDHATLTIDPVMTSDNGNYQCEASNPLSKFTSQVFTLDIAYGPQIPTITGPNAAKTGDNVTFSCYASSNPPSTYEWFLNGSLVANTSKYITPPLTKAMSWMYTCMAYNNITGKNSTAYTMLTVFDPIDHVQVETPTNPAIEGHFYQLTCNVTGPVEHVYWLKNGEPLHQDNRTVSNMANKTLTFNPLEQNDTGYYQCMAINAVWNMTSSPYMLLVNFGPETPMIDGPAFAEAGSYAVFHCSAVSVPPSRFTWFYNGSEV
ncbi:hemicentin-1-like, partial [Centropristis striata]|uniref:hemicentin-1-like n=1 Tax=Centropristis striata TaxID=184440 RepID=UPI0027E0EEE4